MRRIILDTDAFSVLAERRPGAEKLAAVIGAAEPLLTFASVAELLYGAMAARWGSTRLQRLDRAIARPRPAAADHGVPRGMASSAGGSCAGRASAGAQGARERPLDRRVRGPLRASVGDEEWAALRGAAGAGGGGVTRLMAEGVHRPVESRPIGRRWWGSRAPATIAA